MEFNNSIAIAYGVEEAIMIHNLWWWVEKNRHNGQHHYEGKYWTYNTMDAFTGLFKFWTLRQVRRIIESCAKQGAIEIGNFNKSGYNRTNWYTVSREIEGFYVSENLHLSNTANAFAQNGKSNSQNGHLEMPYLTNGNAQTDKCITDNKPYINQIVNTDRESAIAFLKAEFLGRYETEFLMKYQTALAADFEKFCADFDDTITIELTQNKITWDGTALLARIGKYARSWIQNNANRVQGKNGQQQVIKTAVPERAEIKRRG